MGTYLEQLQQQAEQERIRQQILAEQAAAREAVRLAQERMEAAMAELAKLAGEG